MCPYRAHTTRMHTQRHTGSFGGAGAAWYLGCDGATGVGICPGSSRCSRYVYAVSMYRLNLVEAKNFKEERKSVMASSSVCNPLKGAGGGMASSCRPSNTRAPWGLACVTHSGPLCPQTPTPAPPEAQTPAWWACAHRSLSDAVDLAQKHETGAPPLLPGAEPSPEAPRQEEVCRVHPAGPRHG